MPLVAACHPELVEGRPSLGRRFGRLALGNASGAMVAEYQVPESVPDVPSMPDAPPDMPGIPPDPTSPTGDPEPQGSLS